MNVATSRTGSLKRTIRLSTPRAKFLLELAILEDRFPTEPATNATPLEFAIAPPTTGRHLILPQSGPCIMFSDFTITEVHKRRAFHRKSYSSCFGLSFLPLLLLLRLRLRLSSRFRRSRCCCVRWLPLLLRFPLFLRLIVDGKLLASRGCVGLVQLGFAQEPS